MTQAFTQGEPNLVNEAVEISSQISLSLPKTLSLPSSPSISQISTTSFPPNFSTNLDDRYTEHLTNNTSLRLDLNTFVAPPPLLSQHLDSNRLYNWALNRLQYRHDIHKDIQEHNIQILTQDNLTLKFEKTVKLNNLVHHSLPLAPPNFIAQSLPSPFITTEIIYKYDRTIPLLLFQKQQSTETLHLKQEPKNLLVTHYGCEENEQKTLLKYAINQVTQCESEPREIETTNIVATIYSKARATTLTGFKFTTTFSGKKYIVLKSQMETKNRLDHEFFFQINIERLLHLSPEDFKNELNRLN